MFEIVSGVLVGAAGGLGYGMLGAVKNFTNPEKKTTDNTKVDFSAQKFIKPIVVGAILGGYAGSQGMVVSYESLEALTGNAAIFTPVTAVANKAVSIIWSLLKRGKKFIV